MLGKVIDRFVVAYPSGNTTAIVFDELETFDREKLNAALINAWKEQKPDQPPIEQCCFVTAPKSRDTLARLEMFGGEFCANAARSVVWLTTKGRDCQGQIEVSGVTRPLEFSVKNGNVALEVPLPKPES